MMKRNVVSLIKFFLFAAFTVLLTIVVFRYARGNRTRNGPNSLSLQNGPIDNLRDVIDKPVREDSRDPEDEDQPDKIDWHDYKKIAMDKKRKGMGEQGKPAFLTSTYDIKKAKLYQVNGFNAALSDEISLNRSLPDIRHVDCKKKQYASRLDSISVVVSFHNEHFTTLLRTCWSVINRSPETLLEEILLVDDASTKIELKQELDEYVARYMPKVKIIRLAERSGLMRGRIAGAKRARAKVLVFLDSHSEANVNWLPPLLEPIAEDYKNCVCPFIDVISYETFEYRPQDEGARGAFDWEFYYKRLPLLAEDLKRPAEPFKSPIMAGGLFAISAKFFWELGGYDPGLDIWGGEQYELSFKIWQCGGQMFDVPCSRVGHIYRKFSPFPNPGRGDFLGKNYKRVAEVWMDEYAEFLYRRRPHLRTVNPGDLSEQKALRSKLGCKSFKWFIETIAFDLIEVYPPVEPDDFAHGEIRNIGASNLCLDSKKKKKDESIVVDSCSKDNSKLAVEQEFRLTWHKDIRLKSRNDCLDVSRGGAKAPVTLFPCHGKHGNQLWRYDMEKQWLKHGNSQRCLDTDPSSKKVYVTNCDSTSSTQKWRLETVNMKMMNNWENVASKLD